MGLTYKDAVSTILVAIVMGLWYAFYSGIKVPFITSYRIGVLALFLIGIGMCAFTSTIKQGEMTSNPMILFLSILGGASLLLGIAGLMTGSKIIFQLLAGTIVCMWIVATVRHLFK